MTRNGETAATISETETFLKDDVLTIGFARRFATYKRATLLFKDLNRLDKIINNPTTPLQIVFAGKAHPQDTHGQKFIEEIYKVTRMPKFRGKIIILENYDMKLARYLVSGVDVWLNNPRRPMEASGTSGQKVPLNGGLNFSVLDGWWRESYDGENGWAIGEEKDYPSNDVQDFEDANDFYLTLSNTIIPLYYQEYLQGNRFASNAWLKKARISLITNIAKFSAQRMVKDYVNKLYIPAIDYGKHFKLEEHKRIFDYMETRNFLKHNWPTVTFENLTFSGDALEVRSNFDSVNQLPGHHIQAPVDDSLPGRVFEAVETDVDVSVYLGELDDKQLICEMVITDQKTSQPVTLPLECVGQVKEGVSRFKGHFKALDGKPKRLRLRVYPKFKNLQTKFEFGMISWL